MSCRSCTKIPTPFENKSRNMLGVYCYPGKRRLLSMYESFMVVTNYKIILWGVIKRLQDIQRPLHQVIHLGEE